jgi:uncharacterized protein (TIGR02996 family)
MSDDGFDPVAIEQLAIESFKRVDAKHLSFEVVPGQARAAAGGVMLTIRTILWRNGPIEDVKEQEVWAIPGALDDERIPAYFEGAALGAERLAASGDERMHAMPYELLPMRAARDPECRTVEQFAARVGEPEPEIVIEIEDPDAIQPIAANPELERTIDEDPDRVEPFLVYADWLSERGDPRGELIACQAPDAPHAAHRRAAQLLARHETYLVGPYLRSDRIGEYIQWTMRLGYLDSLRLASSIELEEEHFKFVENALKGLMQLPITRFLRGLTFGCTNFEGNCNFRFLYPTLVDAGPRPTLRDLCIGDFTAEEQEISWTSAGNLADLAGLYPNLRSLRVHAGSFELAGGLAYPKLEKLSIRNTTVTDVSPLKDLKKLKVLDVKGPAISNLDTIQPLVGRGLKIGTK